MIFCCIVTHRYDYRAAFLVFAPAPYIVHPYITAVTFLHPVIGSISVVIGKLPIYLFIDAVNIIRVYPVHDHAVKIFNILRFTFISEQLQHPFADIIIRKARLDISAYHAALHSRHHKLASFSRYLSLSLCDRKELIFKLLVVGNRKMHGADLLLTGVKA